MSVLLCCDPLPPPTLLVPVALPAPAVDAGRVQIERQRREQGGVTLAALPLLPATEVRRRFYLRFNVEDRPHVLADIADILGRHNISIASVIQKEAESAAIPGGPVTVPLVIMTHACNSSAVQQAVAAIDAADVVRGRSVCLSVLDD